MAQWRMRELAISAVCCLIGVTGCTSSGAQPPVTSPPPAPTIGKPLDVSSRLEKPCADPAGAIGNRFKLAKQKENHNRETLSHGGRQSTCELYNVYGEQPGIELRFYPAARPLPLLASAGNQLALTSVSGYPAGIWKIDTGQGNFTSCQTIVDLAETQGLGVLYNGPSGERIDGCALAQQAADLLVTALAG